MALLSAISIDGVTFNQGERIRIDYEPEVPLPYQSIAPGIHCLTHIYSIDKQPGEFYLAGYRAERPDQFGRAWGDFLSQLREEGYVLRKLGSPKGARK